MQAEASQWEASQWEAKQLARWPQGPNVAPESEEATPPAGHSLAPAVRPPPSVFPAPRPQGCDPRQKKDGREWVAGAGAKNQAEKGTNRQSAASPPSLPRQPNQPYEAACHRLDKPMPIPRSQPEPLDHKLDRMLPSGRPALK